MWLSGLEEVEVVVTFRVWHETTDQSGVVALVVLREEVESVKAGSAVYLRKSKLFFRSTKQAALDHIEARASSARAQPAATPAAADLPDGGDC